MSFYDKILGTTPTAAAPQAENASTPGRSTLQGVAEAGLAGLNPLSGGLAAGRYVGSLFGSPAAASAPVQQQSQGQTTGPAQGGGGPAVAQITAPPGSPEFRVLTAAAANNLAQLVAIQTELLAQLPRTDEITAGITAARHWLMERVAATRDQFQPRLTAAQTTSKAGDGSGLGAVEAIEIEMDRACTPFLDGLMHGDPTMRYHHTNHDLAAKVFSAVRLHGARHGVDQIGNAGAEQDARTRGGLASGDWCGAFAFAQQNAAGGLDGAWAFNMGHEKRIRDSLNYIHASKWIWTGTEWKGIEDYHRQDRGSPRSYREIQPNQAVPAIEPGDIVLKDLNKGTDPDHITSALTSDGRHLQTLGGNEGDNHPVHRTEGSIDLQTQGGGVDARRRDENNRPIPETQDPAIRKNQRVHGIGRWSIVDYEQHDYSAAATKPTAPPSGRRPPQPH